MKRTILLVADNPYFGGVTSHLLSILAAFSGHDGFAFRLATFPGWHDDAALIEGAEALGVRVQVIPMAFRFDPRVRGAFSECLRGWGVDLVHTHGYRGALIAALSGTRTPIVSTSHGEALEPAWRTRLWQFGALRAMRNHGAVVACSEFTGRWLVNHGIPAGNVQTVYNCFEGHPMVESGPTREDLDIPAGALVALYAGRLAPGKGLEHLLDAVGGVSELVTLVLGEGPLRARLEGTARSLDADVRFLGHRGNPGPYYRLSDVVVLPSRLEALPMTLIEAAHHGRPAVATRVGGTPEVVSHEETGYLVEYGDAAGLREALNRCKDPGTRDSLGQAARLRWESHFSPVKMSGHLEAVYRRVLDAAGPG